MLADVEDIMDMLTPEVLERVMAPVFTMLARCIGSPHFQVRLGSLP